MRIVRTRVSATVMLICCVAMQADAPIERIVYVEPPLRVLTQCEYREVKDRILSCQLAGWPHKVALAENVGIWKGKDTRDLTVLRSGDLLDIKLGLAADSREVATFIWANLVQVEGVVGLPYHRNWMRVFPLVPFSIGELSEQPVFAYVDGGTALHGPANRSQLRQGSPVIVIGERIDNWRIRATRLISAAR